MNLWRLNAILILTIAGITQSGCSILPQKELYVPLGSVVEIAGKTKVPVIYTNKETGKREKRVVIVKPDGIWHIGKLPPKEDFIGPPAPKKKKPGMIDMMKSWFRKDKADGQ